MPTTNAIGIGVRHAVTRALATHNLGPADATFRVESSRVTLDDRDRVVRAEATVRIGQSRDLIARGPTAWTGWVNPDGAHPLMVWIPSVRPFWMDVVPVTWERWTRCRRTPPPPGVDATSPRVDVAHADGRQFAADLGKRLPTADEVSAAWDGERFPWGPSADPALGRHRPHRWEELPEVGLHPPSRLGLWDLGTWLWQWTHDGALVGGADHGRVREPGADAAPVGLRLVQDAGPGAVGGSAGRARPI